LRSPGLKKSTFFSFALTIFLVVFSFLCLYQQGNAQSSNVNWSSPEQISGEGAQASQAFMASDQYGNVHVFWAETDAQDGRSVIMYSRFDGDVWSLPIDIHIITPGATNVVMAPYVDQEGTLHLIWNESNTGPIFYMKAPAVNANSAKQWTSPIAIEASAFAEDLVVDSNGVLHILYSDFYGETPGVYYINSTDGGKSWSSSLQIDPDIPDGLAPTNVNLGIDDQNGLHALWMYVDPNTTEGQWIRYSRSVDGGETWSEPMTIDKADESSGEIRMPYPEFLVSGNQVHVIWAGDSQTHREHRYSLDYGQTWSQTARIWGDLNGQALGGGVDVDSLGRLHYATQVRYPMGIYHASWENGTWTIPSLIYFIAANSDEPFGNRVHAHNVRLAIRDGNQIILTFTSSPTDPKLILYAMKGNLLDAPSEELVPTPSPTIVPSKTPLPTTDLTQITPVPSLPTQEPNPPESPYQPARGILWGLIPAGIILLGILAFRFIRR
jgi:BNR repeat-like domain